MEQVAAPLTLRQKKDCVARGIAWEGKAAMSSSSKKMFALLLHFISETIGWLLS